MALFPTDKMLNKELYLTKSMPADYRLTPFLKDKVEGFTFLFVYFYSPIFYRDFTHVLHYKLDYIFSSLAIETYVICGLTGLIS